MQEPSQNPPLNMGENPQLASVGDGRHRGANRRYTKATQIVKLARDKYNASGHGITFKDLLSTGIARHKHQAQDTIKHLLEREVIFTIGDYRPQRYFPTSLKAKILEDLNSRNNPQLHPTGVNPSPSPIQNLLVQQKSQSFLDMLQTLPKKPLHIHKLQLQTSITREAYNDVNGEMVRGNRAKPHEERIGDALVTYLLYPNGKVIVSIACSNRPFKMESDIDEMNLIAFLGQVRDRLIYLLSDRRECLVHQVTDWFLKQCDVNKDVELNELMQLTLPDVQLKHAGQVFRLYVKSLKDRAVYRVEESMTLNFNLLEAIQHVRLPKIVEEQQQEILVLREIILPLLVYHLVRIILF